MRDSAVSPDLLEWAERFIATSSVSREGNRAIAICAAELLTRVGLEPRLEPFESGGTTYWTVLADLGPAPGPGASPAPAPAEPEGLLLLTHLDTVPPGDPAAWTATGGDPLRPTRAGDRLYGLGSADAKVDFVCKAAALAGIERSRLGRRLRIVGTFGEEIGLLGSRWLVDSGHTEGFRYALVGEPSELVAIRAHKGYAVFEAVVPLERASALRGLGSRAFRFEGRSAHSSTPQLGENAIERALEQLGHSGIRAWSALEGGDAVNKVPDLCTLRAWQDETGPGHEPPGPAFTPDAVVRFHRAWRELLEKLGSRRDADFDPDHTLGSLGKVRTEGDRAVFHFDLRSIPGVDVEEAVVPLHEVAEVRCVRRNPPLSTPLDSPLLRAMGDAQESSGLPRRSGTKATCTEAGILADAGLDAVILGAGVSVGNVHRPNEHTLIPQLSLARSLYRETILRLCAPEES